MLYGAIMGWLVGDFVKTTSNKKSNED